MLQKYDYFGNLPKISVIICVFHIKLKPCNRVDYWAWAIKNENYRASPFWTTTHNLSILKKRASPAGRAYPHNHDPRTFESLTRPASTSGLLMLQPMLDYSRRPSWDKRDIPEECAHSREWIVHSYNRTPVKTGINKSFGGFPPARLTNTLVQTNEWDPALLQGYILKVLTHPDSILSSLQNFSILLASPSEW